MIALQVVGWVVAAPIVVANGVFLIELLLGLLPERFPLDASDCDSLSVRTVVLIAAHNEEFGIGDTLSRLAPDLCEGTSILVVADNCDDRTADVVRSLGVRVVERADATQRGKGFALAFGRATLRIAPPDVVIVFDADCRAEPGTISRLSRASRRKNAAVVGRYLLNPRPDATPTVQISGFAMLVKNQLRQAGLSRLGVPVILIGSGMAFPWRMFDTAPLATNDIVEDLGLGLALAGQGETITYDGKSRIWSEPSTEFGTLEQRSRWENGFLSTASQRAFPLLGRGLRERRLELAWLGLHLLVPPLALLMMLDLVVSILLLAMMSLGMPGGVLIGVISLCLSNAVALGAAWALHGRSQLPLSGIWRIPKYIFLKLPIYGNALRGRKGQWTRTVRQTSGTPTITDDNLEHSAIGDIGDDNRNP